MLEADISIIEATDDLKKEVASIVDFPDNKTPDMLFFSGIFVSSGENLNKAYFKPSELIKAAHTINNKPLDIEHAEDQIVGHIYSSKFVDRSGKELDLKELSSISDEESDKIDMDVMIAGILYKSRFPQVAEEVTEDKWKLSMETYFQDYDIKIGNVIMSRKEAEALGLVAAGKGVVERTVRVLKSGKEIAVGEVVRVLRGLLFSGCGLVKNPANPRSVILETAKKNSQQEEIVIDLDNIVDEKGEDVVIKEEADIDTTDIRTQTSVGICVSYRKTVYDATFKDQRSKVLHTDWCTLYEKGCTSPSRGADHPDCLRWKIKNTAKSYVYGKLEEIKDKDERGNLLSTLKSLLNK
jgi:hypothetical protein